MKRFPHPKQKEFALFKKLKTPTHIQDFIDRLPINFERSRETYRSPLKTLEHNEAHCMEGALLAAAIFWHHGQKPLVLDLKVTDDDESHVVALFKENGLWGAISKTNHAVLRYRDPVYANMRELVMSYFNEYYLQDGKKTLRSYAILDLSREGPEWVISRRNLWHLVEKLEAMPHATLLKKETIRKLRPVDKIEIEAGDLEQWSRSSRSTKKEQNG